MFDHRLDSLHRLGWLGIDDTALKVFQNVVPERDKRSALFRPESDVGIHINAFVALCGSKGNSLNWARAHLDTATIIVREG